jgi:hypothetical protein
MRETASARGAILRHLPALQTVLMRRLCLAVHLAQRLGLEGRCMEHRPERREA